MKISRCKEYAYDVGNTRFIKIKFFISFTKYLLDFAAKSVKDLNVLEIVFQKSASDANHSDSQLLPSISLQ